VPAAAKAGTRPGARRHQVNILAGASLTPGDLEELKDLVESFGLRPVVIPDLSDSLDGHLTGQDFSPLTIGGTPVSEVATLGDAAATLVIGASQNPAADLLAERTGVPERRFDHLMGLEAVDAFVQALHEISGEPVPARIERQRAQLQDAMLDTHFMIGMSRIGVAADPDLLHAFGELLSGIGAATVAAVAPANAPVLSRVAADTVKVGDLEDFEHMARAAGAELVISNSHGVESAGRLGLPLLRAGFPQYDRLGGYTRTWVGYRGTRQTLFELANTLLHLERGEIHPYRSIYAQKRDALEEAHAPGTTAAGSRLRH
jgi:nitrogenase molybdenum-iron protein NifN